MALIAHVAIVDDWESARNLGEYEVSTRGVSLDEAGFVHAVALDGVRGVLDEFYADIRFSLLLVVLDTDALAAAGLQVTEETPGFPHIHGPIPTDGPAVVAELPIDRAAGDFVVPDLSRFAGGDAPSTSA
ncbi:DUF952 domain-containing protein [Herbiconiux sp. CPCC 205763]|uniref:DUF952 domain-containing protein n=1 Tax=Herbiconiux aconitum TaxID=2970913 RepID=A0ABT2GKX9_9MICO|nr:DUF952 domain-containing protein [Herbiconiux aconitum]MCS5716868.1 DUF952 domain-containing protein [Herbiconiux aconitum]